MFKFGKSTNSMAMFIVAFCMFTREYLPRIKGPYFPGRALELGKLWDAVGWHWESCDTFVLCHFTLWYIMRFYSDLMGY